MGVINRGVRNAFRNNIRTFSIVAILGLSIGLALAMLLANKAVGQKIQSVKSSVGNTITIAPAGFNNFSQANNALTTSQLDKVAKLPHVTALVETLTGRLTTEGTSGPTFGGSDNQSATTSLKSPVKLNVNGNGGSDGPGITIMGGGQLPTNFSPPIETLGTTDPTHLDSSEIKITSGQTIDGSKDTNQALISSAMASQNSLSVGSTFQAYNTTLTVAGIFTSDTRRGDNTILLSLPTLERLDNQSGVVTNATATIDSLDNLTSTSNAIKTVLGNSADIQNSQSEADNTVKPLENIKSVSLYSLVGAVVAGAVIIFLTMLMIVRERRREIGVIKAIGASNLKIMGQFMAEAVTLTLLAAMVGIIIAFFAADPITKTLVNNSSNNQASSSTAGPGGATFGQRFSTGGGPGGASSGPTFVSRGSGLGRFRSNITNVHAVVGWSTIVYGLGAALLIALTGSAIASFAIAKVRPAEVMRTE